MSDAAIIEYLHKILESIDIVSKRSKRLKSFEDFLKNDTGIERLDSISMRLQAIGETIKKVAQTNRQLLDKHPEVDWKDIINFRDKISHHYFEIDAEVIFNICKDDFPYLGKQ